MNIHSSLLALAFSAFSGVLLTPAYSAQIIKPTLQTQDGLFVAANQSFSADIDYSVSAPETTTEFGLGLRIHFDSNKLSFNQLSNVFATALQPIGNVQDDVSDYDNNPDTDKYIVVAWVDSTGQWDGNATNPAQPLLTANFTANANFTDSTHIRFTASATSANAAFSSSDQLVCSQPEVSIALDKSVLTEGESANLNINLSHALPNECLPFSVNIQVAGTAEAATDYNTISSNIVISDSINQLSIPITTIDDSLVENDENITISLQAASNYQVSQNATASLTIKDNDDVCFDIDKNNQVSINEDAILLSRYLLNYRDSALIQNAVAADANRVTANDIQTYIAQQLASGCYDIDGNGRTDALTDGVLLIRYLSNYQGDALINNAIGSSASRSTSTAIKNYLDTLFAKGQ